MAEKSERSSRLRDEDEARARRARRVAAPDCRGHQDSVSALEALERNDISRLPGGIFSRAFVRRTPSRSGSTPSGPCASFSRSFRRLGEPGSRYVPRRELREEPVAVAVGRRDHRPRRGLHHWCDSVPDSGGRDKNCQSDDYPRAISNVRIASRSSIGARRSGSWKPASAPLLDFFRRGEVARDIRLLAAQGRWRRARTSSLAC